LNIQPLAPLNRTAARRAASSNERNMPKDVPSALPSVTEFLFGAPLYANYQSDNAGVKELVGGRWRIDGHCPFCQQASTFRLSSSWYGTEEETLNKKASFWKTLVIDCTRKDHDIIFYLFISADRGIQKVGQYPSLADIANDESRNYRKVLSKEDAAEFHRAIGLASHGVGIGSYVYLRRIFERLISKRFFQFKASEGWQDDALSGRRMDEKIDLLKDHLPEFLVSNSRIYGILSQGIHELDEAQCLAFFEVLKASIVLILEEDKKKLEEIKRRLDLERAIAAFSPKIESD
jgi:hypothetical protein